MCRRMPVESQDGSPMCGITRLDDLSDHSCTCCAAILARPMPFCIGGNQLTEVNADIGLKTRWKFQQAASCAIVSAQSPELQPLPPREVQVSTKSRR